AHLDQARAQRLLPGRHHREPGAGRERPVELDALDAGVPPPPAGDVAEQAPDDLGRGGGLDRVLGLPGRRHKCTYNMPPYFVKSCYTSGMKIALAQVAHPASFDAGLDEILAGIAAAAARGARAVCFPECALNGMPGVGFPIEPLDEERHD